MNLLKDIRLGASTQPITRFAQGSDDSLAYTKVDLADLLPKNLSAAHGGPK